MKHESVVLRSMYAGPRFVVWLVAGAASVELVTDSVVAAFYGAKAEVAIRLVGAAVVFPAAALVERIKGFGGE